MILRCAARQSGPDAQISNYGPDYSYQDTSSTYLAPADPGYPEYRPLTADDVALG